jgi:hypothetical protein
MELCGSTAQSSAQKPQTGVERVEEAAQRINQLQLPRISFWWTILLGGYRGYSSPSVLVVHGAHKSGSNELHHYILYQHAYFEDRAWVSSGPNGAVITVLKDNVQEAKRDAQGNIVIQLNK